MRPAPSTRSFGRDAQADQADQNAAAPSPAEGHRSATNRWSGIRAKDPTLPGTWMDAKHCHRAQHGHHGQNQRGPNHHDSNRRDSNRRDRRADGPRSSCPNLRSAGPSSANWIPGTTHRSIPLHLTLAGVMSHHWDAGWRNRCVAWRHRGAWNHRDCRLKQDVPMMTDLRHRMTPNHRGVRNQRGRRNYHGTRTPWMIPDPTKPTSTMDASKVVTSKVGTWKVGTSRNDPKTPERTLHAPTMTRPWISSLVQHRSHSAPRPR